MGRAGPFDVDWPRSAGYFGGVALAVGVGLIDLPLGIFIAAVPFFKMLDRSQVPQPLRVVGQFFEGAAKPVGGDSEGTIALVHTAPVRRVVTRARRRLT